MKKSGAWIIGIVLVVLIIGGFYVFGNRNTENIKMGVLIPLSGDYAVYAKQIQAGTDLAVSEINSNGGVKGRNISIIYEDSKADVKTAITAYNLMKLDTPYIVTIVSGIIMGLGPLTNESKTVLINIGAKSPKISSAGDYVFSLIANSNLDEKVFAKFVKENLKISKVATIYLNSDYGLGTSKAFEDAFKEVGGEVVASEKYEVGASDFRTQLTKIKELNPQGIYLVGTKEQATLLKQAKELGINSTWLAPEPFATPEIISAAGDSANGVIYHTPGFDITTNSEPTKTFIINFKNKYGIDPDYSAANAYDSVMLLKEAYLAGKVSGEDIKNWLYTVNETGTSGRISFDKNGDLTSPLIRIMTIKNQTQVKYI